MAILPIIIAPDPRLKKKAETVEAVDTEIGELMANMLETMYLAPGIGLAAPQIGILKRVIVLDITKGKGPPDPICMANPEITWCSDEEVTYEEGCLSLPEQFDQVTRPAKIRVSFLNKKNMQEECEADGLLATCIQHEMDHLEGLTLLNKASRFTRSRYIARRRKQAKRT